MHVTLLIQTSSDSVWNVKVSSSPRSFTAVSEIVQFLPAH